MKRLLASLSLIALLAACGSSEGGSDAANPGTDTVAGTDAPTGDDTGTSDATIGEDAPVAVDVKGAFTISVDVAYPADAVQAGFRPVAAVYNKADYSDFTQRPKLPPLAALLGDEGALVLKGPLMDYAQTAPWELPYGEYSVVLGIAPMNALPKPEKGHLFTARAIRTDAYDTLVTVAADDAGWAVY